MEVTERTCGTISTPLSVWDGIPITRTGTVPPWSAWEWMPGWHRDHFPSFVAESPAYHKNFSRGCRTLIYKQIYIYTYREKEVCHTRTRAVFCVFLWARLCFSQINQVPAAMTVHRPTTLSGNVARGVWKKTKKKYFLEEKIKPCASSTVPHWDCNSKGVLDRVKGSEMLLPVVQCRVVRPFYHLSRLLFNGVEKKKQCSLCFLAQMS